MKKNLSLVFCLFFFFGCAKQITQEKQEIIADKENIQYYCGFEEEDETDAWTSDSDEISWQRGGMNGSKGCLKVSNAGESGLFNAEKKLEWQDERSIIEFDYYLFGINEELYVEAFGAKASMGVRPYVKGFVKEQWGHAIIKASQLQWQGKSGKGDSFRNLIIVARGIDKNYKDPYMLIDNVVIRNTKKEEEKK